jgi:hypothetical protein
LVGDWERERSVGDEGVEGEDWAAQRLVIMITCGGKLNFVPFLTRSVEKFV